jgi:hypothetical protein
MKRIAILFSMLLVVATGSVSAQAAAALRDAPVPPPQIVTNQPPPSSQPFVATLPCRLVDTRGKGFTGAYGPPALAADAVRRFTLWNQCGIPFGAKAISLNVTVTGTSGPGYILIYPASQDVAQPTVSTLNYSGGQTIANAAVVLLGVDGAINVVAGISGTHLIVDMNGYYGSSGSDNVFLGSGAGNFTMTGGGNVGIGGGPLLSNTSGDGNTAIGSEMMLNNKSGSYNTAVGYRALWQSQTGNENIAIGFDALGSNTSGSGNISLGNNSGIQISSGSNNIYLASAGFNNESGTIRIGDNALHVGTVIAGIANATTIGGVQVFINSGGRMGTTTSSARFKEDVRDMASESDGLMRLRPVAFRYKPELDPDGLPQYGLIAEEVAKVYPDLVTCDDEGREQSVRYQFLVPMLVNEIQKDRKTIEELKARLDRLESATRQ